MEIFHGGENASFGNFVDLSGGIPWKYLGIIRLVHGPQGKHSVDECKQHSVSS